MKSDHRAALCRVTLLAGVLLLAASQASAGPTFAPRHATGCATCHVACPGPNSGDESFRPGGGRFPDDGRGELESTRVAAGPSPAAAHARLLAGRRTDDGSQVERGEAGAGLTVEVANPVGPTWWLAVLVAVAVAASVFATHRPQVQGVARRESGLDRSVAERPRDLECSKAGFDRVVTALAAAVEAKDPSTLGHEQRVARLAEGVGRRLGINGRRLEMLCYAAILHDVGKIGVPETILRKTGALTPQERSLVERHVEIGVEILSSVDILAPAVPFIRYHQERWDGRTDGPYPGYHGLKGEEIPLEARIISVVDAFDAMASSRPYRPKRTQREALDELRREAGHQFDPAVVEAFACEYESWAKTVKPLPRGDQPGVDSRGKLMRRTGERRDRRHPRYDVDGVSGSLLYSVEVTILDISAGGMQVETASRLTLGRRDTFKLRREDRTLQLQGKVAWSVLTGTARVDGDEVAPVYRAGIAFDRTLSEEGRQLVEFMQESITFQPEYRVFGRLPVADEGSATAELGSEVTVKRVSLSGMLVESDIRPRLEEVLSMEVRIGETHPAVSGRVAYVAEVADSGGRNHLGIEFLDLTERQRADIARFIEQELSAEDLALDVAG